jgi:hypothetical protein
MVARSTPACHMSGEGMSQVVENERDGNLVADGVMRIVEPADVLARLSKVRIRVRGNLIFSPYQGNNTQRRQAVNSFDQRLLEEIEKMK